MTETQVFLSVEDTNLHRKQHLDLDLAVMKVIT